ncbi:MAG: DinB family protein [Candidatus Acidiferrales bacterium]
MKRTLLVYLTALLLPYAAGAQQASHHQGQQPPQSAAQATAQPEPNPVSNSVRKIMDRRAKLMVAAAEAMPADKYSFRPTPEQMTFGHLLIHTAEANNFLCSSISGMAAPADTKPADTDPKEKLVAALKSSFDNCAQALAKIDDSNLGAQVPFFGDGKISRAGAMIALTDVAYDHYSMAAMYLRLNGVTPPSAQPKKD